WRRAGCMAPPVTPARWSRRPPVRCATTTSTARWWCRSSEPLTRHSSPPSDERQSVRSRAASLRSPRERPRVRVTVHAICSGLPALGDREHGEDRLGISGPAAAMWLRSVAKAASRSPRPDLVWSGPEVPGLHARDTRRVYEELLGSARASLWASTYVFFDGPKAFEVLARRMDAVPELRVTLLLNIQRRRGDTTA